MPSTRDHGIYIAAFHLPRARSIKVGALGLVHFKAGIYVYVGSAQRNLIARLERHARRSKPLRWHIDYLSTRARMLGALIMPGRKHVECRVARALAADYAQLAPGFGCSDCRCRSHLFMLPVP
jgi:sugar fermentation stimulation protein A